MFYSILKESGYFQFKNLPNNPISKRYALMKSNFSFIFFAIGSPLLLTLGLLSNSVFLGVLGLIILASIPFTWHI